MTHTGPMRDSDGEFQVAQVCDAPCRKCGLIGKVTYRVWESHDGGYEDYQYACSSCGVTWWIDGIDS